MGAFGNKFRKEREKRGFSLDDVSNVTKIGSRMLQAIEEERFDVLPGGVFNKGFIRAYAKHLGLNDEDAVTEYLECLREAQITAQTVAEPERVVPRAVAPPPKQQRRNEAKTPPQKNRAQSRPSPKPVVTSQNPGEELPDLQLPIAEHVRPKRNIPSSGSAEIPWGLIAAVALILVLGIFLWNRRARSAHAERPATSPAAASLAPTAAAQSGTDSSPLHSAVLASASPAHTLNPSSPNATSAQLPSSQPTAPVQSHAAPAKPQANTKDASAAEPEVTVRHLEPPAAKAPEPFTLIIRATENSWISVSADGNLVSEETLIAPAHTSVRATGQITVKTGNAAGLTFVLNGKEIPAQGAESEVKTMTFTPTGIL